MCVWMCGGLLHGNGLRKVLIFAAHCQHLIMNCTSLAAEKNDTEMTDREQNEGCLVFQLSIGGVSVAG